MVRLRLSDVTVVLKNHPCLAGVSLLLAACDIALIRGRSGAGKSTLLRTIAGEQPGRISGSVSVEGAEPAYRSIFGWVPQDRSLWSHMSVLENVVFVGRSICHYSRDEAHCKAQSLLASLGLASQAKQFPNTLSGGQARRGALARTLMANPVVLLLDEVTSGLDPASRSLSLQCIERAASEGAIVVLTSHETEDTASFSRLRNYRLERGELVEEPS